MPEWTLTHGLSMILEHFERYKVDIIVGSKRHRLLKYYPWPRQILSWGYQLLVKVLFGFKYSGYSNPRSVTRRKL
jgi:hypothetical protein